MMLKGTKNFTAASITLLAQPAGQSWFEFPQPSIQSGEEGQRRKH